MHKIICAFEIHLQELGVKPLLPKVGTFLTHYRCFGLAPDHHRSHLSKLFSIGSLQYRLIIQKSGNLETFSHLCSFELCRPYLKLSVSFVSVAKYLIWSIIITFIKKLLLSVVLGENKACSCFTFKNIFLLLFWSISLKLWLYDKIVWHFHQRATVCLCIWWHR